MTQTPQTSLDVFAGTSRKVDQRGNYTIETCEADEGDVHIQLPEGRSFCVSVGDAVALRVTHEAGALTLDLGGDASEPLVLGNALKALLMEFLAKYDSHTHGTSMGPTTPPVMPSGASLDGLLSEVAKTQ